MFRFYSFSLIFLAPFVICKAQVAIDGYAAMVSTNVITASEVMSYIQMERERAGATLEGEALAERLRDLYDQGLDRLIEKELILEQYRSLKGQLPDRAVDDQVNDVINRRFGGDFGEFQKALFAQGQTLDNFRKEIKEDLIVTLMRRQEVSETLYVPLSEIRKVYRERAGLYTIREQMNLQVIQLDATQQGADSDEPDAHKLHASLKSGELDFTEAARKYSKGFNAAEGGVMGWKDVSDIRPEIVAAVKKVSSGEVGELLTLEDSVFIIKLLGHRPQGIRPLAEVYPEIKAELTDIYARTAYQAWIQRLRHKFPVTFY